MRKNGLFLKFTQSLEGLFWILSVHEEWNSNRIFFYYWPCSNCCILVRCIWLWLRSWLAVGADSFFYKVSGQSLAWQCGFLLWFTEGLNSSLEFLRCTICLSGSLGFPACSALLKLFPVCGSTHSFIVMPKPLCGHAAFSAGSPLSPVPGKKKWFLKPLPPALDHNDLTGVRSSLLVLGALNSYEKNWAACLGLILRPKEPAPYYQSCPFIPSLYLHPRL